MVTSSNTLRLKSSAELKVGPADPPSTDKAFGASLLVRSRKAPPALQSQCHDAPIIGGLLWVAAIIKAVTPFVDWALTLAPRSMRLLAMSMGRVLLSGLDEPAPDAVTVIEWPDRAVYHSMINTAIGDEAVVHIILDLMKTVDAKATS